MIRSPHMTDIPAVAAFLEQQFERTHYAREHAGKVDVFKAKRLLMNAIASNGVMNDGGCCVKVIERAAKLCGLMIATLQPVYLIGNKLCATNLFWVVAQEARGTDGALLLLAMIHWAKQAGAIEIKCDTTAIIQDPDSAGRMLERWGFKPYGNLYRLDLMGAIDERGSLGDRQGLHAGL